MVCLPRVYRHRPPEIRGRRDIGKKLLLDRLAVAAHREPRSCGIKTQRESPDSRSASWHARALSRKTGSRRGEPESPETSCSGKERRSELESVGHRKRHSPPALSSEVSHVHLATPLPEQLFAERPAAAADRLHGEDEARLRQRVAFAAATLAELVVGGVLGGRGGSVELVCARTRLLALSLELELAHLDAGGGGRRFSACFRSFASS